MEQKKFYVRPEHLLGIQGTLVRALTLVGPLYKNLIVRQSAA